MALTPPGSCVNLTVLRNGKHIQFDLTVGDQRDDRSAAQGPPAISEVLGMTVENLTPELAQQFGRKPATAVVVTAVSPASIAALAGIRPGTIILQVDREAVRSVS